jgi:uncharacterized membrane protein YphA (DoxX/SURF4 family)
MAQTSEVLCLVAFPLVLARYGFKTTMCVGILGWIVRNLLFATGWLPLIGTIAVLIGYAFILVALFAGGSHFRRRNPQR